MTPDAQAADDKVVLDEEAKRLKLEEVKAASRKAIAQSQKDIAEAEKSALAAQLPTSDTEPLEGKVELGEKVGLVADLLAHGLLNEGATRIVGRISDRLLPNDARVLIVEDRALATSDWQYTFVKEQIAAHKAALEDATETVDTAAGQPATTAQERSSLFAPTAAITSATAIAGGLAALVGMFRTNYAIAHRDVTIGADPLVAAFANALLTNAQEVVVESFELLRNSQVIEEFNALAAERSTLEFAKGQLHSFQVLEAQQRVDDLRTESKALTEAYVKALGADTAAEKITTLRERLDEVQALHSAAVEELQGPRAAVAFADKVLERFDAFATAVTATAEGAKYPPLVAAAVHEWVHQADTRVRSGVDVMQAPGQQAAPGKTASQVAKPPPIPAITHILYIGAESAGGETITRRGLFVRSGKVAFIGGVQVSFFLHNVEANATVAAGTESLLGRMEYSIGWSSSKPPVERIDMNLRTNTRSGP